MTAFDEITEDKIEALMESLFPYGAGQINHIRARYALEQAAQVAYTQCKHDVFRNLMSVSDVAIHFDISERRARALIKNRHERFGVGKRVGKNTWIVHRDELPTLQPDEKYK